MNHIANPSALPECAYCCEAAVTDVTRYRDPGHFAVGAWLVSRSRRPSQLDREAGLGKEEGAKGRKLEKGRDIASGAPSFN